ncbi:RNA-dependent RNA polymerase [Verticillium alfalfae VaMs.102]|uniref:RNA-dependent RNA polymerase n=1 Tax=Verticillium alfalfae (strain VaMs.102 / ATCC MYA-4576 / FGSC 10136) TaxID=526221 RepID=C9SC78_VERA1|nr:RNA-dependent RNA polymerase [Verticillium alfalfae VaMs.102]EEY15962.1 RNA-dependent RNA polymerase [Verticillium alfalfae VaMs.102]
MQSPNKQASGTPPSKVSKTPREARQTHHRQRSGISAPAQRPGQEDWRRWPQISIRLRGLPITSVQDIHYEFTKYGNIVYIEHFEGRQGQPTGEARIRFEPPPVTSFWSQGRYIFVRVNLPPAQAAIPIRIELDPPSNAFGAIRSTVNSRLFYPARMTLDIKTLEFGPTGKGPEIMPKKQVVSQGQGSDSKCIRLKADFRNKTLAIYFPISVTPDAELGQVFGEDSSDNAIREYKILIDLAHMRRASLVDLGNGDFHLTIPLRYPPAYYFKNKDIARSFEADRLLWTENDQWVRASHVLDDNDLPQDYSLGLLNQWDDLSFVDIGRWTTFRMRLDAPGQDLRNLTGALEDLNIELTRLDKSSELPDQPCLIPSENQAVRNKPVKTSKPDPNDDWLSLMHSNATSSPTARFFDFPVQYQLEVCISRGVLCEYKLSQEFLDRLRGLQQDRAKWILEYFADRGKAVEQPMDIFESHEANCYYPNPVVPHYCAIVRKVVVTPTTIYLSSPGVEASNRVIRKYQHVSDRFLRVQFTDELTRGRISTRAKMELDHYVFKRVYLTMINGIRIGDRHYKFLAFGNSQIRECGAYFFCETVHLKCTEMRQWMGNFNHIHIVAKFAARLGQCFSTTREIRSIRAPNIQIIPDIERNGHCFTDGVGKISSFLASMVLEEMGLETVETPSAFQFRMGGCKGVLAVWPEAKGMYVHIRKSQEKFKATFNGLEIIRCARFSAATLNRQTITILTSLGIKSEVFMDLLQRQLHSYEKAMNDQGAAAVLLGRHIDENHTSLALRDLINWGFMRHDVQEPFVLTILQLWRVWSMKLLRDKARIVVDKGAFVLGCVDETATLRGHNRASEGQTTSRNVELLPQIFLQIPDPDDRHFFNVIKGVCIVGRNPSLHPGDIRVVEAVDVPQLRHMKNVVVFPSTGDVDVPSMLSGGDLDGDDFFVIWDPDLIPPVWNFRPMDNAAPQTKVLDRDVNTKDLSLQLAKLHSKAVDYVKSGDPAELGRELRARRWPHFMGGRRNKNSIYHSYTALGQIYDRIQDVPFNPLYEKKFDRRILTRFAPIDNAVLKQARRLKSTYDTAMRRLMAQREVSTEFEIWTGFPLSRPRVGNAYKHSEDIGRDAGLLKQSFRDEVHALVGGSGYDKVAPFVAAMYQVTARGGQHRAAPPPRRARVAGDPEALPSREEGNMKGACPPHYVSVGSTTGSSGPHRDGRRKDEAPTLFTDTGVRPTSTALGTFNRQEGDVLSHRGQLLPQFDRDSEDEDEGAHDDGTVYAPPSLEETQATAATNKVSAQDDAGVAVTDEPSQGHGSTEHYRKEGTAHDRKVDKPSDTPAVKEQKMKKTDEQQAELQESGDKLDPFAAIFNMQKMRWNAQPSSAQETRPHEPVGRTPPRRHATPILRPVRQDAAAGQVAEAAQTQKPPDETYPAMPRTVETVEAVEQLDYSSASDDDDEEGGNLFERFDRLMGGS